MKLTAAAFKQSKNKRLTLLGMSGVGKTHLAKLFSKQQKWFHYSGDYRIGSAYLNEPILTLIKNRAKHTAWLKTLLDNHSINIQNKITFDNLSSVASFLGKVGNPQDGGLPIDEFTRRQALHNQAEINTMLDVPLFIDKAATLGFDHFINDAGGSLGELDNEKVYQTLSEHTLILYIKANETNQAALIKRAQTHPKPLYYQPDFLTQQLQIYLKKNQLIYIAQINPDDFARWVFPKLLAHRLPKYQKIADKYGYTVDSEALYSCQNAGQILETIYQAMG